MPVRKQFDEAYYHRYYLDPMTRVASPESGGLQAGFIANYLRYLRVPVRRILDLGCGLGLLREPLIGEFPRASYTGVEASEHLCERFGWQYGSAVDYVSERLFDLVICYEVVQYLDARRAAAAIDNLATLCRGVLYFGALTTEDWEENVEQRLTDRDCHLRSTAWYRRRLRRHFANAGGGVFVAHGCPVVLYDLEKLG